MQERRRYCRIPQDAPIDLSWNEHGEAKMVHARYLDISVEGLRVESPAAIPQNTEVTLRAEHIEFTGTAMVRHVTPSGTSFTVGLQLSERTIEEIFGFSGDLEAV